VRYAVPLFLEYAVMRILSRAITVKRCLRGLDSGFTNLIKELPIKMDPNRMNRTRNKPLRG